MFWYANPHFAALQYSGTLVGSCSCERIAPSAGNRPRSTWSVRNCPQKDAFKAEVPALHGVGRRWPMPSSSVRPHTCSTCQPSSTLRAAAINHRFNLGTAFLPASELHSTQEATLYLPVPIPSRPVETTDVQPAESSVPTPFGLPSNVTALVSASPARTALLSLRQQCQLAPVGRRPAQPHHHGGP
jgi:hypothetical protein